MSVEGGADFSNVGSMAADDFVELIAGGAKLFGPVGDVGCRLGVDLFATGWSESRRAGFAPPGKPCLRTAHTIEHACMLDLWLIVSTQVLRDRP